LNDEEKEELNLKKKKFKSIDKKKTQIQSKIYKNYINFNINELLLYLIYNKIL